MQLVMKPIGTVHGRSPGSRPWVAELGPRGEVHQPAWMTELMRDYY